MWITIPASCYVPLASQRRCLQLLGRWSFYPGKMPGSSSWLFGSYRLHTSRPLIVCTFLKDVIGIMNQPLGFFCVASVLKCVKKNRAFLCFTQVWAICVLSFVFFPLFLRCLKFVVGEEGASTNMSLWRNLVDRLTFSMYHLALEFHIYKVDLYSP